MALKDITLGQYFPGKTVIHRLDPRVKLIATVIYIVALFLARGPVTYGVLLALLTALILISGVGFKSVLRGMKPVFLVVLITGLLNLFYTPAMARPWSPSGCCASTRRASGRRWPWCCVL